MQNENTPTEGQNSTKLEAESALRDAACCASFESCNAPHPNEWSDKKCNREKGHGGQHACIEYYGGRQNEWWNELNNRPQDGRVCSCEDAPCCGHYEL